MSVNPKDKKMWDGRFEKGMAQSMIDLSFSLDFDAELIEEDIQGSIARGKGAVEPGRRRHSHGRGARAHGTHRRPRQKDSHGPEPQRPGLHGLQTVYAPPRAGNPRAARRSAESAPQIRGG